VKLAPAYYCMLVHILKGLKMLCDTSDIRLVCNGAGVGGPSARSFPPLTSRRGFRSGGFFSASGVLPVKFTVDGASFGQDKHVTVEVDEATLTRLLKISIKENLEEWAERKTNGLLRWGFGAVATGIVASFGAWIIQHQLPSWLLDATNRSK